MSNTTKGPFMQAMEKYTKSIKTFISAQGFGHYSKPSGGIPKADLDQSVQTSLGKADSALQSFTETDPTVPAWAKASTKPSYTASEVGLGNVGNFKAVSTVASQELSDTEKSNARANIGAGTGNGTYSKPSGGIPKTDLASAVQTSLGKADSALQSETDPTVPAWAKAASKPSYTASEVGLGNVGNFKAVSTVASQGLSDTEKSNARANIGAGTGNGTYSKPSGGIPKTDLASAVQTSLGKADSALQSETDPTVPAWAKASTKPSYTQDEVGDGTTYKRVSATEKTTWNNKGTYSKPSGGIPKTDLASAVQTSLGKADSALQSETDPTVPSWAKQTNKPTYNSDEISDINRTHKFATAEQLNQINTNKTNILSVKDMVCDDAFSTSKSYAVGDITIYDNKLYKFKNAHRGAWSASDVDQISLSEQNSDLTYLEAEDRAALAEVVDSGAKNLLSLSTAVSSGSVWNPIQPIPAGTYIISGKFSTSSAGAIAFNFYNNRDREVGMYEGTATSVTQGAIITLTGTATQVRFWTQTNNVTISDWMICTKAAFGVSNKFVPFGTDPFYQVPINHNMIYRGKNLGDTLTDSQHTALSSGNFTDLYLGDYWTKTVTIPAGTYTGGDRQEVTVPAQTNITLKAVIADFDTFYAGYALTYASINTHHAAVIVTGFSDVVWNGTKSTAGGYVNSLIHKWLVGSVLPQIGTWFGSVKVLSHKKLLTNAITGDAASNWAWSSQKISLLSENQMYGSKVWGGSKATNGGYEPGEAFKHLNVFNHIDANLLFGNKNIWLRDIASAKRSALLFSFGNADNTGPSETLIAPAALILLS